MLLRERALGRKCREPLSSGRQQTRRIGNTYCNSSKIRYTFYPARSRTHHTTGSRSRLLMDKGSETPFLSAGGLRFDAMGDPGLARRRGCSTKESSSARKPRHKAGPAPQHPGISHGRTPPPHRAPPTSSTPTPTKPKHPGVLVSAVGKPLLVQVKGS